MWPTFLKDSRSFISDITFLSPLGGYLLQQWLQEWPHIVISFYITGHNSSTMDLIVVSIVISKFLHCKILVIISTKSFFQQNFNLKWTRIQRGLDLRCCCMLFFIVVKDLLAYLWRILWRSHCLKWIHRIYSNFQLLPLLFSWTHSK